MSELSLLNLLGSGISNITIVNRTVAKAEVLANKHNVSYDSLDALPSLLEQTDIVISSTSSQDYIITNHMIDQISDRRKGDSLVMIDIAVPRDIEPGIDAITNIFNYDVDDLKGLVDANLRERQLAAEAIAQQIPDEIDSHNEWVNMLGVVPVIRALREKSDEYTI